MTDNACPIPLPPDDAEQRILRRLLSLRTIAIVGLSDDPARPSHDVAQFLLEHGKRIIPINPGHSRIMGLACYATLEDAPGPIELVNVFRRSPFCPDIVRSAIAIGAQGVWLQSGIISDEAKELANAAGLDFVQNRCIASQLRLKSA
jgi:predicted CoA-binding protein